MIVQVPSQGVPVVLTAVVVVLLLVPFAVLGVRVAVASRAVRAQRARQQRAEEMERLLRYEDTVVPYGSPDPVPSRWQEIRRAHARAASMRRHPSGSNLRHERR